MLSVSSLRAAPDWQAALADEFTKPYMIELSKYLQQRQQAGVSLYPLQENIFNAFILTPLAKVKVVLLGQDPYHGEGQAHGLAFSVPSNMPIPPSLRNMYRELQDDLGIAVAAHGCLQPWAEQGVFLLNSVLTVEHGQAAAHQGQGWEVFTDKVIQVLNEQRQGLVFLLWGSYAQKKATMVDERKHLVLKAPHPSPLSAYRGFFGCRHFSQVNAYLTAQQLAPIQWLLADAQGNL